MANGKLKITDYVVAVTNQNTTSQRFGTAFVIHRAQTITYLLTCKHVIDDVGSEGLLVGYRPASVVVADEHFDLALLRCEEPLTSPALRLKSLKDAQSTLRSAGYTNNIGKHGLAIQTCDLELQNLVVLESKQRQCRSHGWWLRGSAELVPGCSGSPVLDAQGFVVGIISHKLGNEQGFAVAVETLLLIWPDAPPDLLLPLPQDVPSRRTYQRSDAEFLMNCENELDLFKRIAAGAEAGIRLINVYGEGGMGKSRLLGEFQAVADNHSLDYLRFPLGVDASVEERLDELVAHYRPLPFPNYDSLSYSRPESSTIEKQQNWLRNLTRAFFSDLTTQNNGDSNNHPWKKQRLLLFFDQYEKSNEIFCWWMEHVFLVQLPSQPLIVIVAGREPIKRSLAWRGYYAVHLNGVSEEWYYKYAQHRGVAIETQQIKAFYSLLKGKPKEWVEYVSSQTPRPQLAGGMA